MVQNNKPITISRRRMCEAPPIHYRKIRSKSVTHEKTTNYSSFIIHDANNGQLNRPVSSFTIIYGFFL